MRQDTVKYDSVKSRPLPEWLTRQRDGLNAYQPARAEMKQDQSLKISVISTGMVVLLAVILLTVMLLRKKNKK